MTLQKLVVRNSSDIRLRSDKELPVRYAGTAGFSAAVYAQGNGNGTGGIPAVLDTLDVFQARVEAINTGLTNLLNDRADQTDALINTRADTLQMQNDDIYSLLFGTHLIDLFDGAVDVCAGIGLDATLEASAGVVVFGNGAKIKFEPGAKIGGSAGINSNVGVSLSACIEQDQSGMAARHYS